jgi:ABC-type molybdate transport system permease subunit
MADLSGVVGEVSFTLSITSKETGETRTIPMVGFVNEEQLKALQAETIKED